MKRTHGQHQSRTYSTWENMWNRCRPGNKQNINGRPYHGISVCDRWKSFENFFADMGERPIGASIDRIDVNRGYEPGNCRWANRRDQTLNRAKTHWIEFNGERLCRKDWAARLGISQQSLLLRLKGGWPLERALTEKRTSKPTSFYTLNGETLSVHQWAKRLGITANAIQQRIKAGMPLAQALTLKKRSFTSRTY